MPRDYYEVLGVSRDADEATIKKSFRVLTEVFLEITHLAILLVLVRLTLHSILKSSAPLRFFSK